MPQAPLLSLTALTRAFGTRVAVDAVTLDFPVPAFVGVIGASGAGKSTLLRLVNRMTEASSGEVRFQGQDVLALKGAAMRAWQGRCGMIFQQFNLVPRLDVATNVLHGLLSRRPVARTLFNLWSEDDIRAALAVLERLGIADHAAKRAEALSGGQQQRVAIARALMQDPAVILADEPIASLDPMNAALVMDTLRRIHDEDGRLVIANLHTLDTARRYCDRIIGMRAGRVVFDGRPDQLTVGVARELYGAGADFDEAATSTSIPDLPTAPDGQYAEAMLAD